MMSLLLFSVGGTTYGVDTSHVFEVVARPALTPVAGAPSHVAGLFDRSGLVMPVVDLSPPSEQPRPPERSDALVVWSDQARWVALLAEQVRDVQVTSSPVESLPDAVDSAAVSLARSIVRIDADVVVLPDEEELIRLADETEDILDASTHTAPFAVDDPVDEPAAIIGELVDDVFVERAHALAQLDDAVEDRELDLQLVVARLGGEIFCLPVSSVREFCRIPHITPFPCCPAHILGCVNLRGEVITVVDLSQVLRLPPVVVDEAWTLAIVECRGVTAAIAVDEAITVIAMERAAVEPLPPSVQETAQPYLMGLTHTPLGVATIIDFDAILSGDALVVDEGM